MAYVPKMSVNLARFYVEIQNWIDLGMEPFHPSFSKCYGLCSSVVYYADWQDAEPELRAQFKTAGLSDVVPFNKSMWEYEEERDSENLYSNPKRLKWILLHADAARKQLGI